MDVRVAHQRRRVGRVDLEPKQLHNGNPVTGSDPQTPYEQPAARGLFHTASAVRHASGVRASDRKRFRGDAARCFQPRRDRGCPSEQTA